MAPLADTYREEEPDMSVQTRDTEAPAAPAPRDTIRWIERAMGVVLMLAGAAATVWAIPTAIHYPMALAVSVSICLVGVGVVWQKSWAAGGMLLLGLLLCSSSIGYLLLQGPSLLSFSWVFVPGAALLYAGLRSLAQRRTVSRISTDLRS
jgi:hypothetical protein